MDLLCDLRGAHPLAYELEVGTDGATDAGRAVTVSTALRCKELLPAGFGFGTRVDMG